MRDTQMRRLVFWRGHGGMVMSLFGDVVVLERRDFGCDMPLGPDLVFSANPQKRKRFVAAERKKASVAPEFEVGAKATISRGMGKNRRGESVEQVTVTFPVAAQREKRSRALDYVVRAMREDGTLLKEKRVYSPGVNLPPEKDAKEATCVFAVSELAPGVVRFTVAPANCWRVEGHPISQSTTI